VVLVTAAVAVAIGHVGSLPVPMRYRNHERRMYERAARLSNTEARRADVIVMGNSRVLFGIHAQELRRNLRLPWIGDRRPTVAILAGPALTPSGELWLWRRIAAGCAAPRARLAVVGIAPCDFAPRRYWGVDYNLRYLFELRDALWLARIGRVKDAATLLTYRLFPLHALQRSVMNWVYRIPQKEPPMVPPSPGADAVWLGVHRSWYVDYRMDEWQECCLEQMVDEMRAHGIRVMLVSMPVKSSLLRVEAGMTPGMPMFGASARRGRPGSPLRLLRTWATNFARRAGVTYLDYEHAEWTQKLDFWDPTHLLPPSADRFTRELAERINRELAHGDGRTGRSPTALRRG
jgi:hypothetical protein